MKFLNNFITQLTPFFFYAVGGFLVLQGKVSLGALVAALAAYKDLASPWKELLTYYNQTQDMALRWEVIQERFAPSGMVDAHLMQGDPEVLTRLDGDVVLRDVTVRDADGNLVLEDLNATLPKGQVVGIAAPSEEDRRALAQLLTRELLPSSGQVTIAQHDLKELHQSVVAARIGHATSRPVLFKGTFGDNVLMPMRLRPQGGGEDEKRTADAIKAGNSPDPYDAQWLDPGLARLENEHELREWWLKLVEGIGSQTALFRRGLEQRFESPTHPILAQSLVALRPKIREALKDAKLHDCAHFFAPTEYNAAMPVAENLLYATLRHPLTKGQLIQQRVFLDRLQQLGLVKDLVAMTQDVVEMLRQTFGIDGVDHPLFRKLGIGVETYETALALTEKTRRNGADALDMLELAQLLNVPFRISAEKIGPAFTDEMKSRILDFRQAHGEDMRASLQETFAPLSEDQFAPGLTVFENALFGKIADGAGSKGEELRRVVSQVLIDNGLRDLVVELIFDLPIAVGGQGLPASFAEPLAFSRATVKRPDVLILDNAMASYDLETRISVHKNLRKLLPDTTLVYLSADFAKPDVFDVYYELQQGRLVTDEVRVETVEDGAASADLTRKLRALEKTELFAGLNRRQLRLLAFGARWFEAKAGQVVFNKDDDASDGAYMILEGEADFFLPRPDESDRYIVSFGPGRLVGELGLIRREPRALTMVAKSDLTCLRIGEEEFLAVVENDAPTAFKLLQVVAGYVSN